MNSHTSLTPAARALGYAGLLPQIACLALVGIDNPYRFTAVFMGFVYPAVIFSFLGGVWWGQAVSERDGASGSVYVISVLPSLIAAALFLPYLEGWEWPGPAMLYLGAFLALSPMVDRALGYAAADFMRLRWHLSLGLGGLTIALGFVSMWAMEPKVPEQPVNPHSTMDTGAVT
ncbi:MAG: DUF3429 domain-containing protein [Erythrobacter sp.]|uniref:DUF3429 domain-containing protein n=1 Tax=Erythrobacter sp. TaxID=1042 RepID=UPI00262CF72B|nr:DUF3429 domain-containing protein [Erythrobacter sp.]MDJ0977409.1 DUF3429 domain-containing protein [Erythrobacter sp.]